MRTQGGGGASRSGPLPPLVNEGRGGVGGTRIGARVHRRPLQQIHRRSHCHRTTAGAPSMGKVGVSRVAFVNGAAVLVGQVRGPQMRAATDLPLPSPYTHGHSPPPQMLWPRGGGGCGRAPVARPFSEMSRGRARPRYDSQPGDPCGPSPIAWRCSHTHTHTGQSTRRGARGPPPQGLTSTRPHPTGGAHALSCAPHDPIPQYGQAPPASPGAALTLYRRQHLVPPCPWRRALRRLRGLRAPATPGRHPLHNSATAAGNPRIRGNAGGVAACPLPAHVCSRPHRWWGTRDDKCRSLCRGGPCHATLQPPPPHATGARCSPAERRDTRPTLTRLLRFSSPKRCMGEHPMQRGPAAHGSGSGRRSMLAMMGIAGGVCIGCCTLEHRPLGCSDGNPLSIVHNVLVPPPVGMEA